MGLFSRKKSSADVSLPRTERVPATPVVAKPNNDYGGPSTMLRLELSPEVSAPLYERFAHANERGTEGDSRLSLGLFDGSTIGINGRTVASPTFEAQAVASSSLRDPLNDAPPSAFRGRGLNISTPSPLRERSVDLSEVPGPKPQARQHQHRPFHEPGAAMGPNNNSNDYSITLMQANTARKQENLAKMTAPLARPASLDLPRESDTPTPPPSSPSPKFGEQRKPHQSVRQQRSRTLEGSSARNSFIATGMSPVMMTPGSAHPSRPPSSSGRRMSDIAVSIVPPPQPLPTVPLPLTQSSIKNTSVDMSFYPTVVQPMYNDNYNTVHPPYSSQLISQQQQQQQQEPQNRIPHRSKTNDTPAATAAAHSADASPRRNQSSSRSVIPTPTPTDIQHEGAPREHRSRRASASYQPSVTLPPSPRAPAHAQPQERVNAQRPTHPSSPPVSGIGPGASAIHMLRRRSRSIISAAVGSGGGGSGSPHGGSPEKEKANGPGGVGWFPGSSKPTQPAHNLRESRVLEPSMSNAPMLGDRDIAQASQAVNTRVRSTSETAPGGLGWSPHGNDATLPGSSPVMHARGSPSPNASRRHLHPNGDPRMPKKEEAVVAGVAGIGAGIRWSVNNSSNGYIHHPPQTTYMYSTQPPHAPGPVPPTSFPSSAVAQLELDRNGARAPLPARGDSTASSQGTVISALSSSTVRSPAPSSHTSVSNGLSARPRHITAATDVSPMSLDPHAHQKLIKEQERERRREHRRLRKKDVATLESESAGVLSRGAPTPELDDPTTPTAVQQARPQVDTVHMLRMSEERLSDVMRAGDDDPFARVISPFPGSHVGSDDDVINGQLQPPQASSSSLRTPSTQSLSPSKPSVTSPAPSLLQSYPEDRSSTKKRRKHRSEKEKEKDGERKHRSRSSKHAEGEGDTNGDGERRRHKHRTRGAPVLDDGLVPARKHRSHRDKDKDKDSERRHRKRRHHDEQPTAEPVSAGVPAQLDMNGSVSMDPFPTVSTSTNGGGSSSTQFEIMQDEGDRGARLSGDRDDDLERECRRQRRRNNRERHHRHESRQEVQEPPREPRYYPLAEHLCNAELLAPLVAYLTFSDFFALWNSTRLVNKIMEDTPNLRELALEKFLGSVGYRRWTFSERREPVSLSLQELNAYLRGVNVPTHHYPMIAADHLALDPADPRADDAQIRAEQMAASTRAYTKLVIRLRAQAELEQMQWDLQQESIPQEETPALPQSMANPRHANGNGPPVTLGPRYGHLNSSSASVSDSGHGGYSHPPVSRAPSAATRYRTGHHKRSASVARSVAPSISSTVENGNGAYGGGVTVRGVYRFRSPLFKLGHAPLLRVFVSNREGVWLTDENVLKCEQELARAGVTPFLKVGDIVWDVAVGDESNIGRMIWDGAYLIDLDYTYSLSGEISPYIDSLCFPPSYWHKILRIPGDPIVHIDIQPYANEIAANLGLLQSRVQTETPQGNYHTVVRWIHRSSFQLKGETPLLPRRPNAASQTGGRTPMIDQAWEGTVFIEAEGTNEGLEELQDRIGPDVRIVQSGKPFQQPPQRKGVKPRGKTVFRMIRAQSRPGELWLRCAREKEKVLS